MSTNIKIDVRCTEYYELDLHCKLPYEFTVDDIDEVYATGYGEIEVLLTENSSKEFIKLARRDNMFAPNGWKEHIAGSGNMHLTINTPTDWDFYQVAVKEWHDGKLKVKLRAIHEDMECYVVDYEVNNWEEGL